MRHIVTYSVLTATLLTASCSLNTWLMPKQTPASVQVYKNPHTLCTACHETEKPQPGGALFAPGVDPSTICFNCHDYAVNHHPIDFAPMNASGFPFPLFEGKVRCLTCHEIHGGPAKSGIRTLVRGGPYKDRREICFRCHSQEKYTSINPHDMLVDGHKVREVNGKPVCLVCHLIKPDPSRDRTNDVRFRADVGFLCWRCHPPMPDPFFSSHFLKTPSEQMITDMLKAREKDRIILPMVPRGRITCSTCHNPHQEGVIQDEGAAMGAGGKHKLRIPSICTACHPSYFRSATP
jgi:predicted CXXCH cytochrome family protein